MSRVLANTFRKLCISFAIFPTLAFADAAQLAPGQYISAGGWGVLTIKSTDRDGRSFAIDSMGANGHICTLGGVIHSGRSRLVPDVKEAPCDLIFVVQGGGVEVSSNEAKSCRYFCGARAGFEDVYIKPADGCDDRGRVATRKLFKQQYDKKAYAEALATLEPVLQKCEKTLHWLEAGWLRNDLALTQYKIGNVEGCRKTLEPLAKDAALGEEGVRANYLPTDAENYLPIVKAARTNLKLCRAK